LADQPLAYVKPGRDKFDGAILDVDQHGEKSYTIAD
jgi:hypothetical protein